MSIMDFFKPQQAPAQQPAAPVQAPTAQPNGNHLNTATPNVPVNPLDAYKNMFDNANKGSTEVAPQFALDSATVNKVSESLDFTQNIPQDLLTKALAGDAQALIQAMNHAARGAYQHSLTHTAALTDKFVDSRLGFEGKSFSSRVKGELTNSALAEAPNYNHPVVKAELNRIANMLQKEHPDASPSEIAQSAQKYLMDITNAVRPAEAPAKAANGDTDWTQWLNN